MASGRAVPQSRLHRHQPADGARLGGEVLQPARHRRAAHQGRQICLSLDAAVMPEVPAQRGAAATARAGLQPGNLPARSEEHTSELQSLMRISYAVFCLKKKTKNKRTNTMTEYTRKRRKHSKD